MNRIDIAAGNKAITVGIHAPRNRSGGAKAHFYRSHATAWECSPRRSSAVTTQHTFPCYIKALIKTKATWQDWHRFLLDIFNMATGRNPFRKAATDAKTSKCWVYVQADIEHAMRCYGFKKDEVFVVGNPDFLKFGMDEHDRQLGNANIG